MLFIICFYRRRWCLSSPHLSLCDSPHKPSCSVLVVCSSFTSKLLIHFPSFASRSLFFFPASLLLACRYSFLLFCFSFVVLLSLFCFSLVVLFLNPRFWGLLVVRHKKTGSVQWLMLPLPVGVMLSTRLRCQAPRLRC